MSSFEILTILLSVWIILLTCWTVYKDFIEGPKIKLHSGDSIDIVKLTDCTTRNIHVACAFANTSRQAGIVNKVAILLKKKDTKQDYLFNWNLFYGYQGGHNAVPISKVCPILVPANSSILQAIEFKSENKVDWQEGEYNLKVVAWVNKTLSEKADMNNQFSIVLGQQYIKDLIKSETLPNASLRTVMVKGRELKKESIKERI